MNRIALAFVGALFVFSLSARADLGETSEQIAARYGGPRQTSAGAKVSTRTYSSAGNKVVVAFYDGRSIAEIFVKEGGGEISAAEVQRVRIAANHGKAWMVDPAPEGVEQWTLEDWSVVVFLDTRSNTLSVWMR